MTIKSDPRSEVSEAYDLKSYNQLTNSDLYLHLSTYFLIDKILP